MSEKTPEQVLAHRAAQKKYRETPNGRQKRLEGAARYRGRHKAKLNDAVRLHNRVRKGCINPTDEKGTGPCQICNEPHDTLHFDHDHRTGIFRGWLCALCNKGLGHFKDDPHRLLKAAIYLKDAEMADNAPNSSQFAPFPNLVCKIAPKKIEMHVLTFTGANGSAAMLQTLSSAGCTVTYNAEGNYSFTFPPGGTGAVGWVQICPPVQTGIAAGDGRFYALDSDVLNFATGVGQFASILATTDGALADVIGTVTLLIYVVKA